MTLFFTIVVAGQMIGSLVIDHFGICNAPIKLANFGRILGVALVIAGVVVVLFATNVPATPEDA